MQLTQRATDWWPMFRVYPRALGQHYTCDVQNLSVDICTWTMWLFSCLPFDLAINLRATSICCHLSGSRSGFIQHCLYKCCRQKSEGHDSAWKMENFQEESWCSRGKPKGTFKDPAAPRWNLIHVRRIEWRCVHLLLPLDTHVLCYVMRYPINKYYFYSKQSNLVM